MKRLIVIFIMFSCYLTLVSSVADPFYILNGYSMLWLCALYFVGAWMRKDKNVEKISSKHLIWCGVALVLATWVSKMVIPIITEQLFGSGFGSGTLVNYVSPTIVGFSVVLLVLFSKMSFGKDWIKKIISFVAPTTFGIYLIHTHPWLYKELLTGRFAFVAEQNILIAVVIVVFAVIGIFLFCMMIEKARIWLFRIFKVPKICCIIEELLRAKWEARRRFTWGKNERSN